MNALRPALVPAVVLLLHAEAHGFRNCDPGVDSSGFRAQSGYRVAELEFDIDSGEASGSETHYNFSNLDDDGVAECHVTYAVQGRYQADAGLFLLDAQRSNHSPGCEADFLDDRFPLQRSYAFRATADAGDRSEVLLADNGDRIGKGNWGAGHLSFKSPETCELQ